MNTIMIYPDSKKEKGIHNYSEDLLKETKVKGVTFTRGRLLTFPTFINKQLHIQHEYNILGWFGIPFLILLPFLKLLANRLIITMHTVRELEAVNFVRKIFYYLANFIIKLTAYRVIVHCEEFKEILICDYGFNPDRVFVIRHGVKEVPKFNREKIRKKLNIKRDEKVCLIIGTFHQDHRPDVIIKQSKEIGKKILVVWNSNKGKRYVDYFNETMMNADMKNIEVVDLAEKDGWFEYFYASDLVLLPYVDGIGSGIFQDAMATETPVVCSYTDYFAEITNGYDCKELVLHVEDFPDRIDNAFNNIDKLKEGCRKYAKDFSTKVTGKQHLEVYK